MITLVTGPHRVRFDGITFDGKYVGDGIAGATDIAVVTSAAGGLVVEFVNCRNDNISNILFSTGFPGPGKIARVVSRGCGGNGNHLHRAVGEIHALYSVHYTDILIEDYEETGDGIYQFSDGPDGLTIDRMPMLALYATHCRVRIVRPRLRDAGGFACYSWCDNATMIGPDIDNTVYPFRVQESKNVVIRDGSITNRPYALGAVHWEPYARIDTSYRRAEEGITNFTVADVTFDGNEVDVWISGKHAASGLHGVEDCRARGVSIRAVMSGAKQQNIWAQDAD